VGADKGSNRRRNIEIDKETWHSKTLDGKFTWHRTWDWPEFMRKGRSETSEVFRPSKPKGKK